MKPYVLSLAVGLLVGVIYALFQVRSPAPPVIALVGLLGILLGEQIPPLVKQWFPTTAQPHSWLHQQVKPHMFGALPTCTTSTPGSRATRSASRTPQAAGASPAGRVAGPHAATSPTPPSAPAPQGTTPHG